MKQVLQGPCQFAGMSENCAFPGSSHPRPRLEHLMNAMVWENSPTLGKSVLREQFFPQASLAH
jgi:hypothetical protein